jgi:hypothetical protein
MKKILTILGARPQFIKAATVSRVIRERDNIEEIIVHTGQHFDANISDVFFDQLDIPQPQHNLGIAGRSHGAMAGACFEGVESDPQGTSRLGTGLLRQLFHARRCTKLYVDAPRQAETACSRKVPLLMKGNLFGNCSVHLLVTRLCW